MKLSEAIRLGATMKPQCFGVLHDEFGGSCAMGAAADAISFQYPRSSHIPNLELYSLDESPLEWRQILTLLHNMKCPECDLGGPHIRLPIITHLNDVHYWTRERIADFVELHEALPLPVESLPSPENKENCVL